MSRRTKLKKARMPKWIWQLQLKGFHIQLKKYLHFLFRQRPEGCNWSRALRARYFNRTVWTIDKWDAFLLKWHLAWVHNKGEMLHRIGAMPYYSKHVWLVKAGLKSAPPQNKMNPEHFATEVGIALWPGDAEYMTSHRNRFRHFREWGCDEQEALILLLAERDLEQLKKRPSGQSQPEISTP